MQQGDFEKLVGDTITEINRLLVVKGGEYAGSDDRLANFKRGSALTGATPLQVAFIYASKHYDAVATFVRDQATRTSRPRSESITGRLDDLINYCLLMKALIVEDTITEAPAPAAPLTGSASCHTCAYRHNSVAEFPCCVCDVTPDHPNGSEYKKTTQETKDGTGKR